jgi:lysophospholipase L1-like esterase
MRTLNARSPVHVTLAMLLVVAAPLHAREPLEYVTPPALAEKFEAQVVAYEAEDRAHPPPKHAILFAGDSQFFRWKTLHEDLPNYLLINRGVDSFQLGHLLEYMDRIVLPYEPRLIVLHVGGNDIHNGKSPARLLEDFKSFVVRVHARYPRLPIVFSGVTPSPGRWDESARRVAANDAIRDYIAKQPDLRFIDLWKPLLAPDGRPREDIWVEDRVHPNHAGYLLRAKLTQPLLGRPDFNVK